jgi:hypothetical protein
VIGQREKLSATDIAEIRKYYQCWEVLFNNWKALIKEKKINLFSETGLTGLTLRNSNQ